MPWIGAAISVGGSLLGGAMSSGAAGDAADAQTQAAQASIAEQRRQYDLARSDNAPFRQTGVAANSRLAYLLGISQPKGPAGALPSWIDSQRYQTDSQYKSAVDAENSALSGAGYSGGINNKAYDGNSGDLENEINSRLSQFAPGTIKPEANTDPEFGSLTRKFSAADLAADPVYNSGLKFGLDTGTNAINARAIASGGYDSGATLKALTQFGNDYGSTKANESFNRYNVANDSIYNKLAGVSGAGQQATAQTTAAGTSMANNISNDLTGAGNARAAGIVGGANAWGSAAGGVNNAINNYNSNQTLQALIKRNGGSGGYSSYYGQPAMGSYDAGLGISGP